MTTVVGYLRPRATGGVPELVATEELSRLAASRSLTLGPIYIDETARVDQRARRVGFTAALADIRERRAEGVLLLDIGDLSWHRDIRDTLAFLVSEAGGTLYAGGDRPRPASPDAQRPGRALPLIWSNPDTGRP
jgi:hypothetical protein